MVPRPKAKNGTRRSTFREICAHDYENAFLAPWEALFSDPAPIIARSYQAITSGAQIGISRFLFWRQQPFHTKRRLFGISSARFRGFVGAKRSPRGLASAEAREPGLDWSGQAFYIFSTLKERDWTGLAASQPSEPVHSTLVLSRAVSVALCGAGGFWLSLMWCPLVRNK